MHPRVLVRLCRLRDHGRAQLIFGCGLCEPQHNVLNIGDHDVRKVRALVQQGQALRAVRLHNGMRVLGALQ